MKLENIESLLSRKSVTVWPVKVNRFDMSGSTLHAHSAMAAAKASVCFRCLISGFILLLVVVMH